MGLGNYVQYDITRFVDMQYIPCTAGRSANNGSKT